MRTTSLPDRASWRIRLGGLLVLILIAACAPLSIEEEKELGAQAEEWVRENETLLRDDITLSYIREIGAELAANAQPSPFELRFYVIEDDEMVNAKALPAGAIYIYTGLILAANDLSELASVIARMIGHVTAREVAKQYRRRRNASVARQMGAIMAGTLTGGLLGAQTAERIATSGGGVPIEYQLEIDKQAIETLVSAGYDPNGLVRFLRRTRSEEPTHRERILKAEEVIGALAPLPELRASDAGKLELIQSRLRAGVSEPQG